MHGLTAQQAEELRTELQRRGVAASAVPDATSERLFQLEVADSSVARAVEALRPLPLSAARCAEQTHALIPTPEAERREHEEALVTRITEALQRLPGVLRASVEITLPAPRAAWADLQHAPERAPASVQVTLVLAAGQASIAERVSALVTAWVPELEGAAITVNETEAPAASDCAALSHIGPLTVTSASLPTLRGWLIASLVLHMLTALTLLAVLRRRRPSSRVETRTHMK